MLGFGKLMISLIIISVIFLVITIVSGRILYEINQSSCKSSDSNIQTAHKWAAWAVGIAATGTGIALILLGVLIYSKTG